MTAETASSTNQERVRLRISQSEARNFTLDRKKKKGKKSFYSKKPINIQ